MYKKKKKGTNACYQKNKTNKNKKLSPLLLMLLLNVTNGTGFLPSATL